MLSRLLMKNKAWAERMQSEDPKLFEKLSQYQAPEYLWIGCADSRVPATQLVDLSPGEMFVHRNVANLVVQTDLNCLSVMQYAIDVLKVRHIIVCGHYGCGGVNAALNNLKFGLIDNWLRHVRDVLEKYEAEISGLPDDAQRLNRLCELNVIEQTINACQTTVVQSAWERGQALAVHGWIYGVGDGLLREIGITITSQQELDEALRKANAASSRRRPN
jgi:carbonic anhydrase